MWYQLYWVVYLLWFFWLDLTVTAPKYILHSPLDALIPFNEWFVLPYCSWFLQMCIRDSLFYSIQVNFLAKRPVPVSRYGAFDWCFLAQVSGSDVVHVVKLHVLAAHCPDKRIV